MHTLRTTPLQTLQTAARRGLVSGSVASVFSGVTMAALSKVEEDRAAGALNGPSQWIWGEREAYTRRATLRHTALGYAIHHASSTFWGMLFEYAFGCAIADHANGPVARSDKSIGRICAEAIATGATAYYVDYYVTPRRLRPGFDKHLSPASMFAVYASFAAGLAATAIARQIRANRPRGQLAAGRNGSSVGAT